MGSSLSLQSDCSNCAALCCVTFEFEVSDDFAISKPAETACPNLDEHSQCKVHDKLEEQGFRGCAVYECHGAGQRVTQELFEGRSWQQDPTLLQPMSRSFRQVRRLHELLMLLETAGTLPLSLEDDAARVALVKSVDALVIKMPAEQTVDEAVACVHAFLQSLQGYASRNS